MAEMLFDPEPDHPDGSTRANDEGERAAAQSDEGARHDEAAAPTVAAVVAALGGVEELEADATLAEAGEVQLLVNLCQARQLQLAAHWADLNGVLHASQSAGLPGMERLVEFGGEGTPAVAEFAPAELAAQLSLSPAAGGHLVADALDLRHRLPRLWRLVCAGEVRVYAARRVADATRQLSRQAADQVDATVARYAPRVSAGRLEAITTAAVMAADPQAARTAAAAAKQAQGVWVGRKPDNFGRLSRLQHRIKTHSRWKVRQLRSGLWLWTSPHRCHYFVDHTGTIALGKL